MKLALSWTDQCFLGVLFLSLIFILKGLRKKTCSGGFEFFGR